MKFCLVYITRSGRAGSKFFLQFYHILLNVPIFPPTSTCKSSCFYHPHIFLELSTLKYLSVLWEGIGISVLIYTSFVTALRDSFICFITLAFLLYKLSGHRLTQFSTEFLKKLICQHYLYILVTYFFNLLYAFSQYIVQLFLVCLFMICS